MIAYDVDGLPPFDADFYARARANAQMVAELVVPPRDARAFRVPAGQFFRIVSTEGPSPFMAQPFAERNIDAAGAPARPAE